MESGQKLAVYKGSRNKADLGGHTDQILALALSSDGKYVAFFPRACSRLTFCRYLASGGRDSVIRIWDTEKNILVDSFSKHKGAVSVRFPLPSNFSDKSSPHSTQGLAFRIGSHDLYACGSDRRLTIWSCDEMTYIDTLYGHEDGMTCVDVLTRETAVTGSSDKDVRMWKIVDQQGFVYKGPRSSIDCIAMMNEDHFVSGSQDGYAISLSNFEHSDGWCSSVQLWYSGKRRPECSLVAAHGQTPSGAPWICSVAAARYSDLIATGSSSGEIKLWKIENGWRAAREILSVPIVCTRCRSGQLANV